MCGFTDLRRNDKGKIYCPQCGRIMHRQFLAEARAILPPKELAVLLRNIRNDRPCNRA
jgi:uncharacterized Zn finger protein (UPF0148 family)